MSQRTQVGTEVPVQARRAPTPPPAPCDALPLPLGVASAGTSLAWSRCDHVHAHGNQAGGTQHTDVTLLDAGFMSPAMLALLISKLSPCDANPQPLGVADPGVASVGSRCDHVHAHGDQAGGSEHTVVTALSNGFMSSALLATLNEKKVSFQCDAIDAIFESINIGGAIAIATPAVRGSHGVIAYEKTAIQGAVWQKTLPVGFAATSNIRVHLYWVSATAIAGNVIWAAAFERDTTGDSILVDDFAALRTAAASAAPGTSGIIAHATIDFTLAQADGVSAGTPLRLFVQRTSTALGDTMAGDAQLLRVVVEEVAP